MLYRNLICSLLFVSLPLIPMLSTADEVLIVAGADNTLYEDSLGSVSNGSGAIMVAGRTNGEVDSIRRAVLFFDVAGNIPHGAVVESVALSLYLNKGNGGAREMRLHRLLTDWGEGGSVKDGGGQGAHGTSRVMPPGCIPSTRMLSGGARWWPLCRTRQCHAAGWDTGAGT